jgi:hypothetical protein
VDRSLEYAHTHGWADEASPFLRWFQQNAKDEPWHRFTVVSDDKQEGKWRDNSTVNESDTWSTQAEAGSVKEK